MCPVWYDSAAHPFSKTAFRDMVAKEPRILTLDASFTVPRKMGQLARAFVEHAEADADNTVAMISQVYVCVF